MRVEDLNAEYGEDGFSIDTTAEGLSASWYIQQDPLTGDRTFCRDHFRQIDMYWDPEFGHGMVKFHMNPPLLFRKYGMGTTRGRGSLILRNAVYENLQPSEGTDAAGNVWRFRGKFNALCRGGSLELGPIAFNGHVLIAQSPIDAPVLIRSGGGQEGCGNEFQLVYDPYDPTGEGDDCDDGGGGSGGGGGESGTGDGGPGNCRTEYVYIEVSYDGGKTWHGWWEGNATVCE
jgi:hypothetical protein